MLHHSEHKRLAKRLVPRFSPTWLGGDASSTGAAGVSAVAPPVAITPSPTPAPTTPAPAATPPVQAATSQQQSSSQAPAPTPTPSPTVATTDSSSSVVSSSVSSPSVASSPSPISSSTPVQQTSAAQQSSAAPTTPRVSANTVAAGSRTVQSYTNASGGIVYSTAFITASATPSAAPASSGNTGTIVGAVAGSLVGLVCVIAFVSWIIRQHNKRKQGDGDDFDRQSYLRNSMMIPDEAPGAGRPVIGTQAALALARANTVGPRPPTMIERKPTYLMHNGAPSPSFGPGQVVSFEPGQVVAAPHTADGNGYPSPMAFAAYTPPAQHLQSELARRPSGAQLLTRQPTNGGMYDQGYGQQVSPGGYSQAGYSVQDGYTYPMHSPAGERDMIQSVTPFQAQQYAEITRHLEGAQTEYSQESFHPISPTNSPLASPAGHQAANMTMAEEKHLPNPFDDKSNGRIDSTPPSLPPLGIPEGLSRTGTPIDPNPQHAHWSYDAKAGQAGSRLSVAGMSAPVTNAPTMPPAAYTRDDRTVVVGNGESMQGRRPVSVVDEDDVYGGM